jgi:hypothetical protein
MNRFDTLNSLNKIASLLEDNGNVKEAEILTDVMIKISQAYGTTGAYPYPAAQPTRSYENLINHYKGLKQRNDPSAKIEMDAIMKKIDQNQYGFTPAQSNAFKEQVNRMNDFIDQKNIDDVMAPIFKKYMPKGVTAEGIIANETNIVNDANNANIGNIHQYLQTTKQMYDRSQLKYKPTGRGGWQRQPDVAPAKP